MREKIGQRSGQILRQMHEERGGGVQKKIYRYCTPEEAINTWFYCLAGGEYRDLGRTQPTRQQVINQVGNNEGVGSSELPDNRAQVLRDLQMQKGVNINLDTIKRDVIEYSQQPASQFAGPNGVLVTAIVNSAYTQPGSGLITEGGGGLVLQVGTPLFQVEIEDSVLDMAFPNQDHVD